MLLIPQIQIKILKNSYIGVCKPCLSITVVWCLKKIQKLWPHFRDCDSEDFC